MTDRSIEPNRADTEPHLKTVTLDGHNVVLQGGLLDLDFYQSPQAMTVADAQLLAAIRRTKIVDSVKVWREKGLLLDGYRRLRAYDLLPEEEKAQIVPPKVTFISCETEVEAIGMRYQLQDASRSGWNPEARAITILNNPVLRQKVEDACQERRRSGKKADDDSDVGDQWSRLAKHAGISRSKMNKLATVLDNDDPSMVEKHVKEILSRERSVNACYKEARHRKQSRAASNAAKTPLVKPQAGEAIDCILNEDVIDGLERLSCNSVDLTTTSPPYAHRVLYEKFGMVWRSYKESWLDWLERVFREVYRVAKPGGHCCINVGNTYVPEEENDGQSRRFCNVDLIHMMRSIGWCAVDDIPWYKQNSDGDSPKTGSHEQPLANTAIEHVLVFRKPGERNSSGERTITDKDRYKWLMGGFWDFRPQHQKHGPCPYPFPEELPYRCIELFSNAGDVVLDVFLGNGTTCVVAKKRGRHWIGIEKDEETALFAHA